MIERLQYITQDHPEFSHSELCEKACESGVKWVQLRMKNVSDEVYLQEALKCREITLKHEVKLIINDNAMIAKKVSADGIHVGQEDTPVAELRSLLGEKIIIGGTANTFSDAVAHIEGGADYLGVGPFKTTITKKKLSPILGKEGFELFMNNMKMNGVDLPVIAVGGIDEADFSILKETGVHGIAVSGLITHAKYQAPLVERLKTYLK